MSARERLRIEPGRPTRLAWQLLIFVLLMAWHPSVGRAATALVQSAQTSGFSSSPTSTIQFTTDVTAGNLIALYVAWTNGTDTLESVTDSLGNTYTLVQNPTTLGDYGRAAGAYAANINGGRCTITVRFSPGAFAARTLIAREISGIDPSSPLDGSAGQAQINPGTGIDAVTSGTITTTASGAYIFAATTDLGHRALLAPGTGFTSREALTGPVGGLGADSIQPAAGPIAATFTNTDAPFADFVTLVMAFKPAVPPPAVAQSAQTSGFSSSPTSTIQFTTDVTAGNLIALYVAWTNGTDTLESVTDSLGNTYTLAQNPTTLGDYGRAAGAYAANIVGGRCTITVRFSPGAFAARTLIAREITGLDPSSPLDGSAGRAQIDPGTGVDAVTSGTITTTANGAYIFAATTDLGHRAALLPGTGFTGREVATGPVGGLGADYVQAAAGPTAATFTNTDAPFADFVTLVMAFKPASAVDTTPPMVTLTAPSDGSTVSGTITLAAAASDDLRVAGVQFTVDGADLGAEATFPPYTTSWNTAAFANGPHNVTAIARDAAGNTTASTVVVVTADNVGASQDIIGSARRVEWSQAGVAGGIPNRTTICASFSPGATHAEINAAIAACSGGVVYLSAGTYHLSGGLTFGGRSRVTLRGAGPDQTILRFTGADPCGGISANVCIRGTSPVWSGGVPASHIRNWTGGYIKGTTHITLSSTDNLRPGSVLVLDQLDDTVDTGDVLVSDAPEFSIEGGAPGRYQRSQLQFVQIVAINGNEVAISPGLHMPNWRASQAPQAWSFGDTSQTAMMNGVENLTLDHTEGVENSGIAFFNAYNGWVRNVRSLNAKRNHVWVFQAARIEVRDSYFYGTKNSYSQSYGVESLTSSDDLVINNIFEHVTAPLMTGTNTGSVFAYNYVSDMYYQIATWMMAGIVGSHDAGTSMNLFEGNVGNQFLMDLYHGGGSFTTLFRNQVTGTEPNKSQGNTTPVSIWAYNRFVNVVGNILGTPGYHVVYESSSTGTRGAPERSIYVLGYSGVGETLVNGIPYDTRVASSLLRWGNFDYATNGASWDIREIPADAPQPGGHFLPPSLFLRSRPAWWGTMPWPAIGPDVTGGHDASGHVQKIPAQVCFENSARDDRGILLFNAAACYGLPQ